jgi:hypothetical protein
MKVVTQILLMVLSIVACQSSLVAAATRDRFFN